MIWGHEKSYMVVYRREVRNVRELWGLETDFYSYPGGDQGFDRLLDPFFA